MRAIFWRCGGRRCEATRRRSSLLRRAVLVAVSAIFMRPLPSEAQVPLEAPAFTPSTSDFGSHGLLQTPTSRIGEAGEFNVGSARAYPYWRYYFNLAPFDWFEGTFRYTQIINRPYGPFEFSGNQTYKDRGIDARIRLHEETENWPALALTIRDLGGTGLFAAEAVTLTRRIYDFDLTVGMGWGNLATSSSHFKNPFSYVIKSWGTRGSSAQIGAFQTDFFRGPNASLFGGVEWHTPIEGLRTKFEFDPNNYQFEPQGNKLDPILPINFGLVYAPWNSIEFTAGVERGNTALLGVTVRTNFNKEFGLPKFDTPAPAVTPRPPRPAFSGKSVDPTEGLEGQVDAVYATVGRHKMDIEDLAVDGDAVRLVLRPLDRAKPSTKELGDLAAEIAQQLPLLVGTVSIQMVDELPQSFRIQRGPAMGPVVTSSAAQEAKIDFLYDDLRRRGYEVEDLSFNGDSADVTVKPVNAVAGPLPFQDVAATVGKALPVDFVNLKVQTAAPALSVNVAESARARALAAPEAYRVSVASGARQLPIIPRADMEALSATVFAELKKISFTGERLEIRGDEAVLSFSQGKYRAKAIAFGRAARVLAQTMPPQIERFTMVMLESGLQTVAVTIYRRALEDAIQVRGSPEEIWRNTEITGGVPFTEASVLNSSTFPDFTYGAAPHLRQQVGGPNAFYFYQIYLDVNGEVAWSPGFTTTASVGFNLINNFGDLKLASDSVLPHVRSDIVQYLKKGENNLIRLQSDYMFNIAPDIYGRASAGYFEEMFAGFGGEVLYRPHDQRFAFGLDVNQVWQRAYDQRLDVQSYNVATGHLGIYYDVPFDQGLTASVRIGRYLAKDRGATFAISKEFENGASIGVFATLTNVSAAQFGEGSFDKGFYFSIPLELFTLSPSRSRGSIGYRPLTRDGGQQLAIQNPLYYVTNSADAQTIAKSWPKLLD